MIRMLGHLTLSQRSLRLSSFLFIFTILSSTSLILSSASIILLLVPYRVFFISVITLFIIDWCFFISSRPLLNISYIFSILVSRLLICNSILFSRFWIIFTIIILIFFFFSGRLPISSSFVWFGGCWGFSPWDLEVMNLKEWHSDILLQGLTSLFLLSSLFIEAGTKSLEYTSSRVCTGLTSNQ